jgi:hypothetical protein
LSLYIEKMTSGNIYERSYTYIIYLLNFLYLLTIIGVSYVKPEYVETIRAIAIYYVIFLLFILFNPYYSFSLGLNNIEHVQLERKVAFSSGIFLLFTVGITKFFKLFQTNII